MGAVKLGFVSFYYYELENPKSHKSRPLSKKKAVRLQQCYVSYSDIFATVVDHQLLPFANESIYVT